jgi:hypothetical protein
MKSQWQRNPHHNHNKPREVKPTTENRTGFTTNTNTPGKINQMARTPRHNTPARAGWARIRRAANDLTPQAIEQIAQRVAQLLTNTPALPSASPPVALLTADQLAQQLGVTRAWVYENAHRLGAIRLGTGPRARLRFDPKTATQALASSPTPQAPTDTPPRRPGRPRRRSEPTAPLLPVHEPRRRAILTQRTHPARLRPTHPW